MSILEIMRERRNRSVVLSVPVPAENPEIIFEVERMSEPERQFVFFKAASQITEEEKKGENFTGMLGLHFNREMLPRLQKRLRGWQHLPADGEEKLEYSPAAAAELFALAPDFVVGLVNGYLAALEADNEAAKKKTSTAKDSGKA